MKLPIVVSPEQVSGAAPEGLKIVDLRPLEAYIESHLPGAVHLDAKKLNRTEEPVGGLLPDFEHIKLVAHAIGLQSSDHVLAYDQGAGTAAARLIWVLHAYGFKATSWLNGGFDAWIASGFNTTAEVTLVESSDVQLQFTPGNVVNTDQLLDQLCGDDIRVLDVRSAKEFNGTDVRSARGGHVPGALHLEWTEVFDEAGRLKSDADLHHLFTTLGLSNDGHVVVYCQTHQRSALTYVVLKHLQYQSVSALDGAWSAWGNRTDTPIES